MPEYWVAIVPKSGEPMILGPYDPEKAEISANTEKRNGGNAVVIGRP